MEASVARRMWHVFEPIHDVTYFAPEVRERGVAMGLKGFWMTYFAFRAAPMGRAAPAVVTACFYGFHPSWVERAFPEAWEHVTPEQALWGRQQSASAAIRRIAAAARVSLDNLESCIDQVWQISRQVDSPARPLAAANLAVPAPQDPLERLWQACTVLREHRGDGHLAALMTDGLGPLEANVMKVAAGEADADLLRRSRGWPDLAWDEATAGLAQRGLITHDGPQLTLSTQGHAVKSHVEEATDRLALRPWQTLGADEVERLTSQLGPLADAIRASEEVPDANPVGLGRRV